MGDRRMRFSIALLLTGMDIAVYEHFFGVIWQVWSGVAWIRVVLWLLLAVWMGSAAVLWLHVYYDLRHFLYERRGALALNTSPIANELREDGDV